jgi:hypothetical protein
MFVICASQQRFAIGFRSPLALLKKGGTRGSFAINITEEPEEALPRHYAYAFLKVPLKKGDLGGYPNSVSV